jgi:HK97 family phage major capsid protein
MKIKLADGTVKEVEAGYQVKDGETEVPEAPKDGEGAESGDGEKEMSQEEVKALLQKTAQSVVKEMVEKATEDMGKKFMDGVKEMREKGIDATKKDAKAENATRKFIKALISGDKTYLKSLNTQDLDGAGYLIPTELMTEVLRIAQTFGLARSSMRYLPFSGPGNERKIPVLGSSVKVEWVNEKGKKPASQPSFGLVTQTLKALAGTCLFTEEILEDSAINLTTLVAELFVEAVAKEEDIQFFTGTGLPWTGVLNNGQVNIAYQAVAGVANLTADDLLGMIDATPSGALAGAKFYMNRTVLSVIRKLKGVDGQYIYQNPGQGQPATIWDYPVVTSDAFPTASAVSGTPYILFGNLQLGCIFGDKQQMRTKLLDQATLTDSDGQTEINLAEQDMLALRIVERVGYVVALPAALTVLDPDTQASGSGS